MRNLSLAITELLQGVSIGGDRISALSFHEKLGEVPEGGALSEERRKELLQKARAGEDVELILDAVTFIQRETPNRNFVRFRPGSLRALARSFKGAPVLTDHKQRDVRARAGTIVSSELIDHPDGKAFRQQLHLVKPWSVEGALDGTIDRFSIGTTMLAGSDILCTVCGNSIFWLTPPKTGTQPCMHMPGETIDGRVVEMEYTGAEGVEVSAVNVPAVAGTEVEGIRAALSALRSTSPKEKTMTLLKSLAPLLALSAEASEQDAVEALQSLVAEREALKLKLAASEETSRNVAAQSTALEARVRSLETERKSGEVASFIERAYAQGKLKQARDASGLPVQSATERLLRDMASRDPKAAEEYLGDMPRIVPLGSVPQSAEGKDTGKQPRSRVALTDAQKSVCQQMGISEEEFIKTNGLGLDDEKAAK